MKRERGRDRQRTLRRETNLGHHECSCAVCRHINHEAIGADKHICTFFCNINTPLSLHMILTLPKSRMKQSPWLKLSQLTGTSVALTTRRPLTCSTRCTITSLVTTCLNPDATPPFWKTKQDGNETKHAHKHKKNNKTIKAKEKQNKRIEAK